MKPILVAAFCAWAQMVATQLPPAQPGGATAGSDDYLIGPKDVIAVVIYGEEDYSRPQLTVDTDGTIDYPLIGRVKVGGLSARQVEQELTRRLGPPYLRNPHVSVTVREFRSQRVWVHGAVAKPGMVELKGGATLMNALSADAAGPLTSDAGSYVLIIHAVGGQATGPAKPDQAVNAGDQIRVPRQDFELGRASAIRLRDGDTVFVPSAEKFFVSGEVKQTGSFVLTSDLTVLQALALAGGVTDRGAKNRIEIRRTVSGKDTTVKARDRDVVRAGDTIIVPKKRI